MSEQLNGNYIHMETKQIEHNQAKPVRDKLKEINDNDLQWQYRKMSSNFRVLHNLSVICLFHLEIVCVIF